MTIKNNILMIYPKMGMSGSLVQHMPLSLLYASVDSIKAGFEISVLDLRLCAGSWEKEISLKITEKTLLVGFSVMSGAPVENAIEVTNWIKNKWPDMKIVWGGPHAIFNGKGILSNPGVDYVIAGYGSFSLSQLALYLSKNSEVRNLENIPGLIFRNENQISVNKPGNEFEIIHYQDIPYDLIEDKLDQYGQLDTSVRIFSLYSVMGCPYQCAFCSSPAQYREMKKRYDPLPFKEVVDHIEYVINRYHAGYIYFIDDDSFADLEHVENIIDEIKKRNLSIPLGFRGARVNEIKKMSPVYLEKLAETGTTILHIGAESGSQRILDLIRKNCTVEDILEINRKLAKQKRIKAAYNWIVGLPGETLEDLKMTRRLILCLLRENPSAIIFIPNIYRPLPGTELFMKALELGYTPPEELADWGKIEAEGDYTFPWLTPEHIKMIHMMQIASFFIDGKINKVDVGKTLKFRIGRIIAAIYKPLAFLRFKYGISKLLIEYQIFKWLNFLSRE